MRSDEAKPQGRDQVVAAVVAAAERLFAERGPSRVGLRDIAAAANVNVALIYRHIGSKEDLLRLIAHRLVRSGAEQLGELPSTGDVVELLFSDSAEFAGFTHLAAWLLLEGTDPETLWEIFPVGDVPVAGLSAAEGRERLATVLAMSFGWQVFHVLLQRIAAPEADPAESSARLRARLVELARAAFEDQSDGRSV